MNGPIMTVSKAFRRRMSDGPEYDRTRAEHYPRFDILLLTPEERARREARIQAIARRVEADLQEGVA